MLRDVRLSQLLSEDGTITSSSGTAEALHAAEAALETAERVAHIGSWRLHLGTRQASCSPGLCSLFGMSPGVLDGETLSLLAQRVHPDDWAELQTAITTMLETGESAPVEFRLLRPDGSQRFVRGDGQTERDAEGEPVAIVGYCEDMTERRCSERALRESEQRFRGYFEQGLVGAAVTSPEKGVIEVNQALCDLLGYSREELAGTTWAVLTHPDDLAADVAQFERVLAGQIDSYRMEKRFIRKDGQVVHVEMNASAVRRPDGDLDYMLGMTLDLSERRATQQALRESEERYRLMVETASEGMIMVDADYRTTFCNRRFAEMVGYRPLELVDKPIAEWLFSDSKAFIQRQRTRRRAGKVGRYERLFRRQDGETVWLLVSASPMFDGDGAFAGSLAMVTDITELKAAERRLKGAVMGTVRAMGALVERRDPYTAGHERRVAEAAVAIAHELGLDSAAIEGLRLAAEMHDVGKIAIPAEILSKPGRLSETEFKLIMEHPGVAHEVLLPIEFDFPVAEVIVQHHERLDGSGYPMGLEGEQILRGARILAVADVAEAMSSHRPYRPALGLEAALDEIRRGAGVTYDAEVVAAFQHAVERGFRFSD